MRSQLTFILLLEMKLLLPNCDHASNIYRAVMKSIDRYRALENAELVSGKIYGPRRKTKQSTENCVSVSLEEKIYLN